VEAWNEDGLPHKFAYLPYHTLVTTPPPSTPTERHSFDAVLALDSSTRSRLGKVLDAIESLGTLINIDHHISNDRYGDLNFIDSSAPATGQILFDFFCVAGAVFTPEISTNLYAAISTDTGSFQYPRTTSHTFEVAAKLLESGVQLPEISQAIYDTQPRRRLDLLRHALNNVEFSCGDTIASFSLSLADSQRLQTLPEDNEGIINHFRSIEGVLVAIFFEELPEEGKIRASVRSKDPRIDVSKICGQFGGGGHSLAAGVRMAGSLSSAREKLLNAICHEIQSLIFH
jgi:phosphoesterase RecJ-like protein